MTEDELLSEFLTRYVREFDYYDQLSRLVASRLRSALESAGIRAIVTSRAKSPGRTGDKVKQRFNLKKYVAVADVYADIIDLAGVRVALYFPGQREQVASIIEKLFHQESPRKDFPQPSLPTTKRFRGYSASHFRAQIRESDLGDTEVRYAEGVAEIQVASVLMHAWSEVEHDLVYKPLSGHLSERELALLDQLNGLVEAGEIALEQLQQAGDERVSASGRPFANHYELAAYLLGRAQAVGELNHVDDDGLGRVDLLFELIRRLDLATPDSLSRYIEKLHGDFERRPLAEQIVDALVQTSEERYRLWEELRGRTEFSLTKPEQKNTYASVGLFLEQWVRLETTYRRIEHANGDERPLSIVSGARLFALGLVDEVDARQIDDLRKMRNLLVHGLSVPPSAVVAGATEEVARLVARIEAAAGLSG